MNQGKRHNVIKIMLEASLMFIGFIMLIVSFLYPFAFGKGHLFISHLAERGLGIRVGHVLFYSFILYLISAFLGIAIVNKKTNEYKTLRNIFIALWITATLILSLLIVHFMFVI